MHGDAETSAHVAFDNGTHQHAVQDDAQQQQSADAANAVANEGRPPDGGRVSARTEPGVPGGGGLQPAGRPGGGLSHAWPWQPRLIGICRHTARVTDVGAEIEASILRLHKAG